MIHKSSIVDKKAKISKNVKIGPFCYIGPDVELLENVELISNVHIEGNTIIGKGTKIFPFASIGTQPQDLKYKGEKNSIIGWLIATIVLGFGFLGVKYFEYSHKWHDNLVTGSSFVWENPGYMYVAGVQVKIFFSLYFVMTGMHALHMVIGVGIMLWLIAKIRRNEINEHYFTPVEISGLYWHFVDIVWIFLFPLLYLIGRHH